MKNWLILMILVLSMNVSAQMLNVGNLPVFSVGKTQFTSGKIDTMVQALARQQFKGRQVPPQAINQMKQMVVVNLVSQELLALEAEAKNVKAPKSKVDETIKTLKKQLPSEDAFNKHLVKLGITLKDFRAKIERQISTEVMLEKLAPYPQPPTEKIMKAYYSKYKATAIINDSLAAVEIYFDKTAGEKATDIANKKEILKGLAAQVKAGVDMRQLAAQYSNSPKARETGGVIGPQKSKDFPSSYLKAFKQLKVGEVSSVFTGAKGRLVIVQLFMRNDGTYDSNIQRIQYAMMMEAEQARMTKLQGLLNDLKSKYKVEYFDQSYKPDMKAMAAAMKRQQGAN